MKLLSKLFLRDKLHKLLNFAHNMYHMSLTERHVKALGMQPARHGCQHDCQLYNLDLDAVTKHSFRPTHNKL
jgi:hypothetical protein